ncbi:MAG: hypothetical protein JXA54_07520 [Candidatus Heimdallarchaeota archaeon]|nr:hypothetical protein [Candidatus Heimdallarchaeota archaeon]
MKSLYLDTSVLLARWAPLDIHHSSSMLIHTAISSGKIIGYISDLSIAEVASVVERQQQKFQLDLTSKVHLALEYVKRIRLIPNIIIINTSSVSDVTIAQKSTPLSTIFWKSIDVAITSKLKTLDNIHLAIGSSFFSLIGRKLDYFVTTDYEILATGQKIEQTYDFQVVSPEKLVKKETL